MTKIREEKGAALIEFALVLPILLILVFGIIEFGFFIYDQSVITNASREAARAGIVLNSLPGLPPRKTQAELQAVVDQYLTGVPLFNFKEGATAPVVDPDPKPPENLASGQFLTITVTYPYNFLFLPAFISDLSGGVTIQAKTTMRAE